MAQQWTFIAHGGATQGANPAPALPAGFQAGDLLIVVLASAAAYSSTPPAGWTWAVQTSSGNPFLSVAYKIAQGGDSAPSFTNSSTFCNCATAAYRNVSVNPLDTVSSVQTVASGTTTTTPTTTAHFNDDLVLFAFAAGSSATSGSFGGSSIGTNRQSAGGTSTMTAFFYADIDQALPGTTSAASNTYSTTSALQSVTVTFFTPRVQVWAKSSPPMRQGPRYRFPVQRIWAPPPVPPPVIPQFVSAAPTIDLTQQPYLQAAAAAAAAQAPPGIPPFILAAPFIDTTLPPYFQESLVKGQTPPILPFIGNAASPQIIDLTQQAKYFEPLVSGITAPYITNANAPQVVDLTLAAYFQPGLVKGQTPPIIPFVNNLTAQLTDFTLQPWIRGTVPMQQGPVPPPVIVPQQAYSDVPPVVRRPGPNTQGPVPPLVLTGVQALQDIPAITWPAAFQVTVVASQIASFVSAAPQVEDRAVGKLTQPLTGGPIVKPFFAAPQQLDTAYGKLFTAPLLAQGPVPPYLTAFPVVDLNLKPWISRPTPNTQGPVPPIIFTAPRWDLTQQPLFVPVSRFAPPRTGPVPPMVTGSPPQFSQYMPFAHVWQAIQKGTVKVAKRGIFQLVSPDHLTLEMWADAFVYVNSPIVTLPRYMGDFERWAAEIVLNPVFLGLNLPLPIMDWRLWAYELNAVLSIAATQ